MDILEEKIKEQKYDNIMTCGPEIMTKKILELCNKYFISLQASLEREINCGRGLCGSCVEDEYCICKDGTGLEIKETFK